MIECTTENLLKKKRRGKRKSWRLFSIFLVIIFAIYLFNRFIVCDNLSRVCFDYISSKSSIAVNNAVIFSLNNNTYSDIITIEKNNSGDVSLISANSYTINKISREIIAKTNSVMSNIIDRGVPIPVLAFTGINVLSGVGRKVYFKSLTILKIDCNFSSNFQSVGVNQTLHSIYADVLIDVNIGFLFYDNKRTIKSSVLLCESVIIGKVPNTYLNGKIFN